MKNLFRSSKANRTRLTKASRKRRRHAVLESLEDRRLLATLNVTTLADSGAGSLREAIVSANADPDDDQITFASSLNGGTIQINTQLPNIISNVSIIGPGADLLTVQPAGDFGAFTVGGASGRTFGFAGFTIQGGKASGIRSGNADNVLNVDGMAFRNITSNDGAGIHIVNGSASISNSEFSHNTTTFVGNAVSVRNANVSLRQVTISGNAGGNAIRNAAAADETSSLLISHSTIAFNQGPGVETFAAGNGVATTQIVNSILANNLGNNFDNFGGSQVSLGHNLSDDPTGNLSATGDQRVDAARLGPLAINGGSTQTHALLAGSPAIDGGDNSQASPTDQRGELRIVDGNGNGPATADIGAYELQTIVVTTATDVVNSTDGQTSLREAITQANADPDEDLIIFDPGLDGTPIVLTIAGTGDNQNANGDLDFQTGVATLRGNGIENTIISAGGDSGIGERVIDLISGAQVTIEDVTIQDGRDSNGAGIAARLNSSGSLDLKNVMLSGNVATSGGGGIVVADTGTVRIQDSTISGNSAARGGGINSFGNLVIERSTIEGNNASTVGGGIQIQDSASDLTVRASTFFNNEATLHGGALANIAGTARFDNSTLSGNTAGNAGGAIFNASIDVGDAAETLVNQSTIAHNTSGSSGNVHAQSEGGATSSVVEISNTILVGNDGGTAPDNITFGSVSGSSGAIVTSLGGNLFDDDGFGISVGSDFINVTEPVIDATLGDNGGPTATHASIADGPAIDAGDASFVRPTALIKPISVTTATPSLLEYSPINLLSLDGLSLENFLSTEDLSGNPWATEDPNGSFGDYFANGTPLPVLDFQLDGIHSISDIVLWGYNQSDRNDVQSLTVETSTDGGATFADPIALSKPSYDVERISTLSLGGSLDANFVRVTLTDNYYEDGLSGGDRVGLTEVRFLGTTDQTGGSRIFPAPVAVDIGAFERQTLGASSFIVTTLDDELDYSNNTNNSGTSLREAINNANINVGADEITFANGLNGTISLEGTELLITESVTITGPGQTNLIIDAQQQSRVLNVEGDSTDVTLSGMTISGGKTTGDNQSGGGIRFLSDGELSLTNSTLSGNHTEGTSASGGGIFTSSGSVTLTDSTLSGNHTEGNFAFGGGIFTSSGSVTMTNSTLSGNRTEGYAAFGGGIINLSGSVTLTGSTVSGNRTESDGSDGGGAWFQDSEVTIVNSTITGNSSLGLGGGLRKVAIRSNTMLTIHNSIIAGNASLTDPDVSASVTTTNLDVQHSLIGDTEGTSLTTATGGNVLDVDWKIVLENDGTHPILKNNGGPTQTIALIASATNPAIDTGNNALAVDAADAPLTTDQRGDGFPRVIGDTVDMGSLETSPVAAPLNLLVQVDGTDIVVTDGDTEVARFTAPFDNLSVSGGDQDDTITIGDLSSLIPTGLPVAIVGGGGRDTLILQGSGLTLDTTAHSLTGVEVIDIRGSGSNTLIASQTNVASLTTEGTPMILADPTDTLDLSGDVTITGFETVDDVFRVNATWSNGTRLDIAGMGWTNPIEKADVDGRSGAEALDALLIVNQLDSPTPAFFESLNSPLRLIAPENLDGAFPRQFYDVSGDSTLTALDALLVINFLSSQPRVTLPPESELLANAASAIQVSSSLSDDRFVIDHAPMVLSASSETPALRWSSFSVGNLTADSETVTEDADAGQREASREEELDASMQMIAEDRVSLI